MQLKKLYFEVWKFGGSQKEFVVPTQKLGNDDCKQAIVRRERWQVIRQHFYRTSACLTKILDFFLPKSVELNEDIY